MAPHAAILAALLMSATVSNLKVVPLIDAYDDLPPASVQTWMRLTIDRDNNEPLVVVWFSPQFSPTNAERFRLSVSQNEFEQLAAVFQPDICFPHVAYQDQPVLEVTVHQRGHVQLRCGVKSSNACHILAGIAALPFIKNYQARSDAISAIARDAYC